MADLTDKENDLQQESGEPEKVGFITQIRRGLKTPMPDDLDHNELRKEVFNIAMPAMAESFLMHLISMMNTIMVGGLGTWAIASIGYCSQPRMLLMTFFQGLNVGATALIARAKGAKNEDEANGFMHQSYMFSMGFSFFLAIFGYIFATPMVKFMGAEIEETITGATLYFRVMMLSFPANAFTVATTAVLRGVGKTKVPMVYNVTANIVNVTLSFLFIEGRFGLPALGILGAAIGLAGSQVVAMLIALVSILRGSDMLKLRFSKVFKINPVYLEKIFKIGAPAMLNQILQRVGQLLFTKITASLGTDAFATHQIANNIFSMTMTTGQAFGVAATTLCGQGLGRKRPDHSKGAIQLCRRYSMRISIAMALSLFFFGKPLMGLYTDEIAVITSGALVLKIVALVQPLQSSQQVLAGALRGAGDTKAVAMCTFLGVLIMRPCVAFLCVYGFQFGLIGIWLGLVSDQIMRSGYTMWRFASDKWQHVRI